MPLTFSAPGKVLIIGGYTVLEAPNPGLVLTTTARFSTTLSELPPPSSRPPRLTIHVFSPQWNGFSQTYTFEPPASLTTQPPLAPANPYIATTLSLLLSYLSHSQQLPTSHLELLLQADNDFYSHHASLKSRSLPLTALASLPPHLPLAFPLSKTGLGSSAAMITSLTGALLTYYEPSASPETLHRLAQVCHSLVQGKIGSGFDVSSACYGSQLYTRYSPTILNPLMGGSDVPTPAQLHAVVNASWGHTRRAFALPSRVELVCGDVCGGSESPGMSKRVLEWRRKDPAQWHALVEANLAAVQALDALSAGAQLPGYASVASRLAAQPSERWQASCPVSALFCTAAAALARSRLLLREMGVQADVPIEPPSQTALIDATLALPGVLACGVPGAGGLDAVFALALARPVVEQAWAERGVCALTLRESAEGLLRTSTRL